MSETENPMDFEENEDPPGEDFEEDGGFENDVDIPDEFPGRGRGRQFR